MPRQEYDRNPQFPADELVLKLDARKGLARLAVAVYGTITVLVIVILLGVVGYFQA